MNNQDELPASALQALLGGTLSRTEARKLRHALHAEESRALEIIKNHQLKNGSELLAMKKVPDSVRKRLRAIPRQRRPARQPMLAWAALVSAIVTVAILVTAHTQRAIPEPTTAEIEQARAELIIAFNYLQSAGRRTNFYVTQEVGGTMQKSLVKGIYYSVGKVPENS